MQRPPLFEANCFIYWKNRFETYVKSKDIDLWYIIANGNYKPTIKDKDGKDVVTPYEKLDENQKKMLSKNDEAKMDLEIAKNKKEKYKSLALKARQVLSDDDTSSSDSNDEEYAMAEDKKEDRRYFKCGDPNHFISDCPKNSSGDQKGFVVGSWSDSGDDSKKEEICLLAHSNEVRQKVKLDPDEWIQDSGCTRHMTGNKDLFSSYKTFDGGNVLFGSNTKSKIIGKVLNKETMKVEESLNVKFDETPHPSLPPLIDDDLLEVDIIENQSKDLEVKENEPLNK
ncbi:hypothetical protein Tco_1312636 [Tanacetum coccineum]